MVLLVADPGPLRAAIENELRTAGANVTLRSPRDEDLWLGARGCRAVVYLPSASLLKATITPSPNVERLQEVIDAAGAPGVEVLVPVFPAHPAYDLEVDVLRRDGRAYAALRAPALLEEIAGLIPAEPRALWLPRSGRVRAVRASAVAAAVREAIDTEWQGRVTEVDAGVFNAADLVREAALAVGKPLAVRPLRPWLYRLVRLVGRWLRRREATLLTALAPLLPELDASRRRRALPARSG
ncbi:MAG: hypothetical protein JW751_30910 [Polyangiaceae bacterium]|nr:hypothetical protein [Polyangiaceae bacterium]